MSIRLILLALVALPFVRAAEDGLSLARVLREVSAQHPQVRSARAMADAEKEKITQAAAWDDPTVGVEMMRRDTLKPYGYSELEWNVAQKIPLTDQRRRRVELAKAQANVATSQVQAQLTPLLIQATDAFYHLAHARELLALTKTSDDILARAVSALQARLADGATSVASVLLAETERARLQEQVIGYERDAAEAANQLNTLRNLPPETPIPPLQLQGEHGAMKVESFDTLRDQVLLNRPELRAAHARVTAAERATDVARTWAPDPEITVRARHINGHPAPISEYDTGIAISLPWLNRGKYRAGVREAQRRRDAAELDVAALRSQTLAELRDAWTRHETATRSLTLFRDRLLPLAHRSLEASVTGLDSGRSTILELIAAQKNIRDVRNGLANAEAEQARASAVIGAMTGQDLVSHP